MYTKSNLIDTMGMIVLILACTGCVTASYTNGTETFRLTTLLKKAEGVQADKGAFSISLNKTESQAAEMLELIKLIQFMSPVE